MISTYKIRFRFFGDSPFAGEVKNPRINTTNPSEAEAEFRKLISREDLIGARAYAKLTLDNTELMLHRFDRSPGDEFYVSPDDEIKLSPDPE